MQKLSSAKDPCSGYLYGIFSKSTCLILGIEITDKTAVFSLPVGLEICGYFQIGDVLNISNLKQDQDNSPKNLVVIFNSLTDKSNIAVNVVTNGELEKTDYQTVSDEKVYNEYMFIRCKGKLIIKSILKH